jgi:tripartite-type tricarboxylate transporter receptor subunit TctC
LLICGLPLSLANAFPSWIAKVRNGAHPAVGDHYRQPFVIENRPGGGGNIGTEAVVRAPADGYTLLLVHALNAINATLYDKLNFNFIRDIAPVAGIMRVPTVMLVHPSVPAKTVPEFIAYANANPGKINIASGPIGGASHGCRASYSR